MNLPLDFTSRGHTWLLHQKLLISLHTADLKVEGINLVFLYIETRQFCLINSACVCFHAVPSAHNTMPWHLLWAALWLPRVSGSPTHSLPNLRQSLYLLRKKRLYIIFFINPDHIHCSNEMLMFVFCELPCHCDHCLMFHQCIKWKNLEFQFRWSC